MGLVERFRRDVQLYTLYTHMGHLGAHPGNPQLLKFVGKPETFLCDGWWLIYIPVHTIGSIISNRNEPKSHIFRIALSVLCNKYFENIRVINK